MSAPASRPDPGATQDPVSPTETPRSKKTTFALRHVGHSSLDPRSASAAILPWILADVQRRSGCGDSGRGPGRPVYLRLAGPVARCVPAGDASSGSVFVFEHRAVDFCSFAKARRDPRCFACLVRLQPENAESKLACHVLRAETTQQVEEIIGAIRRASRIARMTLTRQQTINVNDEDKVFLDFHRFEVLYWGKISSLVRRNHPQLVDECIRCFQRPNVSLLAKNGVINKDQESNPGTLPADVEKCKEDEEQGERVDGQSTIHCADKNNSKGLEERAAHRGHIGGNVEGVQSKSMGNNIKGCTVSDKSIPMEQQALVLEMVREDATSHSSDCNGGEKSGNSTVEQGCRSKRHLWAKSISLSFGDSNIPLCQQSSTRRASVPCLIEPSMDERRRAMLFQVGRNEVNLISPHSKKVIVEKKFKDISSCSQGINHVDYFGFVCRDSMEVGTCQYACHIFQCASASLVEEIMQTMKQAFNTAATLTTPRAHAQHCETCPLHALQQLCERVDGVPSSEAKQLIHDHMKDNVEDLVTLVEQTKRKKPCSDFDEVELLIGQLWRSYEAQQANHVHQSSTSLASQKLSPSSNLRSSLSQMAKNIFSTERPTSTNGWRSLSVDDQNSINTTSRPRTYSLSNPDKSLRFVDKRQVCSATTPLADPQPSSIRKRIFLQVVAPGSACSDCVPTALKLPDTKETEEAIGEKSHGSANDGLSAKPAVFLDSMTPGDRLLPYQEVVPTPPEAEAMWNKLLSPEGRDTRPISSNILHAALSQGVSVLRRGEVWKLLCEQWRLCHTLPVELQAPSIPYEELLSQLVQQSQQHAILVDIGRAFPTHPFFSTQMGTGQLSLFNLLKAYSLLDQEVGYCQGLSFIAGILLLHLSEEEAFELLKFIMYDLGFRRQYLPNMVTLQTQMYQLLRLLQSKNCKLYKHLEDNNIGPLLYAAPWFLTLFASQFPLGFVYRILDTLLLQGSDAVFKVALALLKSHEVLLLQNHSFEDLMNLLQISIPNLSQSQITNIIQKLFETDLSSRDMLTYQVEFEVLKDVLNIEDLVRSGDADEGAGENTACCKLRQQNYDLSLQLQSTKNELSSLHREFERAKAVEKTLQIKHVPANCPKAPAACPESMIEHQDI
uniref:TBC1 (tre-2/USP6, BUB2, cdc16) domain family, member 1 n=2 Tax=Eptatretus burgeri TaxID=7764 RepID=A0A8C4WZD0_EPTBU